MFALRATNGWMARITTPSINLPLLLNVSALGALSLQAAKNILHLLVNRPAMKNRELQLANWFLFLKGINY